MDKVEIVVACHLAQPLQITLRHQTGYLVFHFIPYEDGRERPCGHLFFAKFEYSLVRFPASGLHISR
ncbi:MAG: hypothetical protein AAGF54_02535, partial [Pseudomonadota bacterium]